MKKLLVGHEDVLGPWVAARTGGHYTTGFVTIGLLGDDGQVVAAVLYESFNGANIGAHIASDGSRQWACKLFLWAICHYPFVQLGCRRITAATTADNLQAQRFLHRMGFEQEAVLKGAHPSGDLLVYAMFKDSCRWLGLKG